ERGLQPITPETEAPSSCRRGLLFLWTGEHTRPEAQGKTRRPGYIWTLCYNIFNESIGCSFFRDELIRGSTHAHQIGLADESVRECVGLGLSTSQHRRPFRCH